MAFNLINYITIYFNYIILISNNIKFKFLKMKLVIVHLLFLLNILLFSNNLYANYLDGFKEYEKKIYQLAFEHWQEGANQNDTLSQFYLGLLYKNGLGINQDYTKAFELFKIVSVKGLSEGYYNLGLLYYNGLGTEKNYNKAFINFNIAKDMTDLKILTFGERIKFATDILTSELKILENYFQKYEILVDIMKLKGGFTEMFDLKTLRIKSDL